MTELLMSVGIVVLPLLALVGTGVYLYTHPLNFGRK